MCGVWTEQSMANKLDRASYIPHFSLSCTVIIQILDTRLPDSYKIRTFSFFNFEWLLVSFDYGDYQNSGPVFNGFQNSDTHWSSLLLICSFLVWILSFASKNQTTIDVNWNSYHLMIVVSSGSFHAFFVVFFPLKIILWRLFIRLIWLTLIMTCSITYT